MHLLQGELIDRVESNMVETQEFVESSVKHTAQAIINKKKANKVGGWVGVGGWMGVYC